MLYTIILSVHIIVSLFLILIVLLQAGKGGGMGAAFGGGSGTVFGGRGAGDFLSRLTTVMAATFMILSIVLARFSLEDTRTTAPTTPEETTTEEAGAPAADGAAETPTAPEPKGEAAPAPVPAPAAAPTPAPEAPVPAPAPAPAPEAPAPTEGGETP